MMKKFLILIALILMQFVGKAQSSEEVVSFAKDLFPEGVENIERKISEAGEQIRQEANKIFNTLDKSGRFTKMLKLLDAPIYANMDYKGVLNKVRWFRYKK